LTPQGFCGERCQLFFQLTCLADGEWACMSGRQPRLVADGLAYHARNRGNNRPAMLSDDADRAAFLEALGSAAARPGSPVPPRPNSPMAQAAGPFWVILKHKINQLNKLSR
jgi:hypothetical protein